MPVLFAKSQAFRPATGRYKEDTMKKKTLMMMTGLMMTVVLMAGCGAQEGVATDARQAEETAQDVTEAAADTATDASESDGLTVSCKLFSVTLPEAAEGLYIAETDDSSIAIYDKEAKEAGFGGFAFKVNAYREPSEYAGGMDSKIGELTSADGTLYDMVVTYPSDVQYDYTKYTDDMPESYKLLYGGAEDILKAIEGVDGGTFAWEAGTKGEDLYADVLADVVTAINEGWDADKLEANDLSSMYYAMSVDGEGDVLDRVGYAYHDSNNDGIDELFIGEIAEGDWKGTVYDIFTMVDRKPAHVVSGYARSRFYEMEYGMIINEYSSGAMESGWDVYDIEPNTVNLIHQVSYKIDEYENADQPWFISYDEGETWENVTEDDFEARKFYDYIRFDFTPLSEVASTAGEGESEADYLGIMDDHEQVTSTEGCDTFTQMLDKTLADGQGYVNEKIGDTDVFIVAGSTFGGYDADAACDAELFCYSDSDIEYLGYIQSAGSGTPLAVKDGKIFTAGHHYVGKHIVTDGKLMTMEEAWESFDADGNVIYHYSSDDGGDYTNMDSAQAEEIYNELWDEYNGATILGFDTIHR